MIKSVLLAMDGSDHSWAAWRHALDIARAYGAWLRVISVVDMRVLHESMTGFEGGMLNPVQTLPSVELEMKMESQQTHLLEQVQQQTALACVNVQTSLARGVPAEAICSNDPLTDLIALGHHGHRSAFDRLLIGSVAEAVVRRSCRPVLICQESFSPIDGILAAYDGSEPSKRALHWAADLATTMRLPLDVVHVNSSRELGRLVLSEAAEYLKPYALGKIESLSREGEVVDQILTAADERGSGLIVIGAHGHGRIREALLGSTTHKLMEQTRRPLLMTR